MPLFKENRLVFKQSTSGGSIKKSSPEVEGNKEKEPTPKERVIEKSQKEQANLSVEKRGTPAQKIEGLSMDLSPDQQKEGINTLELVCHILLSKLFSTGNYKPAELKQNILLLKKAPLSTDPEKADAEKAGIKKIEEIIQSNRKPEWDLWLNDWDLLVNESYGIYLDAEKRKEEMEKSHGALGIWGNRLLTAGLVIGGGYVAYRIGKWLWSKTKVEREKVAEKAKKETGKVGKVLGWSGALAALTIGACLIDQEHVGQWVRDYLGINITKESLKKFISLIFQGEFKKAFSSLSAEVEITNPFIAKAAGIIEMDPVNLLIVKDARYEDFMSFGSKLQRTTESFICDIMPSIEIPLVYSSEAREKAIEDEKSLYKYLTAHKEDIGKISPEPKTIEEVLQGLDKMGKLEKNDAKKGGGKDGNEAKKLIKNNFGHTAAAIDTWESEGGKLEDVPDMVENVMLGVLDDGGTLLVENGAAWIYKGESWLLLTTANIWIQTFIEALESVKDDVTYKDVLETYYDSGTKYFIWTGAGIGTLKGLYKGVSAGGTWPKVLFETAKSAVRGGARGATGPVEVIRLHVTAGQRLYRIGKDFYFQGKIIEATEAQKLEWLHAKAEYHAKVFKKYYKIKYAARQSRIKRVASKLYRGLYEDRIDALVERHGRLFRESVADYCDALDIPIPFKKEIAKDVANQVDDVIRDTHDVAEQFTRETGTFKTPQAAKEITIETRARQIAETSGKSPEEWRGFREQASAELEQEATQLKPREFKTMTEADAAGLPKIAPEQIARLEELGLEENSILRIRELRATEKEVELLINELKNDPSKLKLLKEVLNESRFAKFKPYLKKAKIYGGILAAVVIIDGYENAEDKIDYLAKTWLETGLTLDAIFAIDTVIGSKIPGWGRLVIDLAAGLAIVLGVETLWNDTGGYLLDRYYPDRVSDFNESKIIAPGLDGVELITASASFIGWGAREAFDGVDADTDPIAYLQSKVKLVRPFGEEGWDKSILKDMPIHDMEEFQEEAKKTLDNKTKNYDKDLAEINAELEKEKDSKKIKRLEKRKKRLDTDIERLKSFTDKSWVKRDMIKLRLNESIFLKPAREKFRIVANSKFKEGGGAKFDEIIQRVNNSQPILQTADGKDDEIAKQVWQSMLGESVEVDLMGGEKKKITFRDFILQSKILKERIDFLEQFMPKERSPEKQPAAA